MPAKKTTTSEYARLSSTFDAISASQAIIEFEPDGTIITANANFLSVTGYSAGDLDGAHHRIFVGLPKTAIYFGYKLPTIRYLTRRVMLIVL